MENTPFPVVLLAVQRAGRLWVSNGELPESPPVGSEPHPVAPAPRNDALPPRLPAGGHRQLQGAGLPLHLADAKGFETLQFDAPLLTHVLQRCLQLEPYNEVCQYMKGLSHVAMGQFYEGIKAQTKVMLNAPLLGQKASSEYLKVKYLRGATRLPVLPGTRIAIIHLFHWSLIILLFFPMSFQSTLATCTLTWTSR